MQRPWSRKNLILDPAGSVSPGSFAPTPILLGSCPQAWDLSYPGICGILRSSPQWGGAGAGWEFRSQGPGQGPEGNAASLPGQPPRLNSQALWGPSSGREGELGIAVAALGVMPPGLSYVPLIHQACVWPPRPASECSVNSTCISACRSLSAALSSLSCGLSSTTTWIAI